jgi:hypothetical protein
VSGSTRSSRNARKPLIVWFEILSPDSNTARVEAESPGFPHLR